MNCLEFHPLRVYMRFLSIHPSNRPWEVIVYTLYLVLMQIATEFSVMIYAIYIAYRSLQIEVEPFHEHTIREKGTMFLFPVCCQEREMLNLVEAL